jgi:hypothetical protein
VVAADAFQSAADWRQAAVVVADVARFAAARGDRAPSMPAALTEVDGRPWTVRLSAVSGRSAADRDDPAPAASMAASG